MAHGLTFSRLPARLEYCDHISLKHFISFANEASKVYCTVGRYSSCLSGIEDVLLLDIHKMLHKSKYFCHTSTDRIP